MRAKLLTSLDRYFFDEKNLFVVGLIRIALVSQLFKYVFQTRTLEFGYSILNQLHQRSILIEALSKFFFHIPPSVFSVVYAAAAIGSLLGLFTRVSLFTFGICSIYITGIAASLGVFNHNYCLVSQVILLLAFIPGSTNFSVERLLRFYLKYKDGETFLLCEAFFQRKSAIWGLRLMLMLVACIYFTAGISCAG
jgi:hypothetical protein